MGSLVPASLSWTDLGEADHRDSEDDFEFQRTTDTGDELDDRGGARSEYHDPIGCRS